MDQEDRPRVWEPLLRIQMITWMDKQTAIRQPIHKATAQKAKHIYVRLKFFKAFVLKQTLSIWSFVSHRFQPIGIGRCFRHHISISSEFIVIRSVQPCSWETQFKSGPKRESAETKNHIQFFYHALNLANKADQYMTFPILQKTQQATFIPIERPSHLSRQLQVLPYLTHFEVCADMFYPLKRGPYWPRNQNDDELRFLKKFSFR